MSVVQLSSTPSERLEARRTFPLQKRTSVCRNLFGPVDHDELQRDMKDKLREISERDQERWNFNFEVDSPMHGLYEWEQVSAEETPAFYQNCVQRTRVPATPVKRRPVEDVTLSDTPRVDVMERLSASAVTCAVNQENRTDKLNSGRKTHVPPGVKRRRTDSSDNNNTHITDFFVKRKKVVERKTADVSSCHTSSMCPIKCPSMCPIMSPIKSPIPLEQTPRKRIR